VEGKGGGKVKRVGVLYISLVSGGSPLYGCRYDWSSLFAFCLVVGFIFAKDCWVSFFSVRIPGAFYYGGGFF